MMSRPGPGNFELLQIAVLFVWGRWILTQQGRVLRTHSRFPRRASADPAWIANKAETVEKLDCKTLPRLTILVWWGMHSTQHIAIKGQR